MSLVTAIAFVSVFPAEKEIWYDETVSIQISKGIGNDTPSRFADGDTVRSSSLRRLNTLRNVYGATVRDNGNSVLYNLGLHWFTAAFGNSLRAYTWFSKLASIATLVAFYAFANVLFTNTIFTSLALLFLASDTTFLPLSYEIRAYSLALFFVTLAAMYFYRFTFVRDRPLHLFLAGLFSAAALLSHYLSAYVILVFVGYLTITKRSKLWTRNNLAAILAPTGIVVAYLYSALGGLRVMSSQTGAWRQKMEEPFMLSELAFRSGRLAALDFKVVLPAFDSSRVLVVLSVSLLLALYALSVWVADVEADRRNLHLLFALAASATVFLALLSLVARHYAALYLRYHAFSVPFGCLFAAYVIRVCVRSPRLKASVRAGILSLIAVPSGALFAALVRDYRPVQRLNHAAVAQEIRAKHIWRLGVPEWRHAFLVNSFLPDRYRIEYVRNGQTPSFTLHEAGSVWSVPVVEVEH